MFRVTFIAWLRNVADVKLRNVNIRKEEGITRSELNAAVTVT